MRVCDCISHLTWINIRFHGDGLGSSCTNESYDSTEDFFYVATSSIAMVVVLLLALLGCKQLFKYKKMIFPLKALFFFASTASICFAALSISAIGLCLASQKKAALIVGSISTFIYAFLFLCIWANLILRLFVAFRGSAYRVSRGQLVGYQIVFILLVLIAFATSVCQLLMLVGEGLAPSIWVQFALGVLFMVVFAASSLMAVCSFMEKVSVLGKSRTKKQVKPFCEEEPIALNQMQNTLLDLSAKYVSLFLLASLSSAIAMFSGFYESFSDLRISLILVPIDCCVNLICIYLQYSFAERHYNKFCGKLDWCCKKMMTAGWVRSIHSMRREERDQKAKEMRQRAKSAPVPVTGQRLKKNPARTSNAMTVIPENLSMQIVEHVTALHVSMASEEGRKQSTAEKVQMVEK